MEKTLTVVFDGEVFRPAEAVDIEPNTSCEITIVSQSPAPRIESQLPPPRADESLWDVLDRMTGTVDGPEDSSEEHDHYLYGTPKRRGRVAE